MTKISYTVFDFKRKFVVHWRFLWSLLICVFCDNDLTAKSLDDIEKTTITGMLRARSFAMYSHPQMCSAYLCHHFVWLWFHSDFYYNRYNFIESMFWMHVIFSTKVQSTVNNLVLFLTIGKLYVATHHIDQRISRWDFKRDQN